MTGNVLTLPDVMDITAAEAFAETMRSHMASGALVLDASQVQRATTPCLQIVLSALQLAKQNQQSITIEYPSEAFVNAIQTLGLAPYLLKDD